MSVPGNTIYNNNTATVVHLSVHPNWVSSQNKKWCGKHETRKHFLAPNNFFYKENTTMENHTLII